VVIVHCTLHNIVRHPTTNNNSCEAGVLSCLAIPRRTQARSGEICAQVELPKTSSDLDSLSPGALSARVDSRRDGRIVER
jgi:hypothetical protein